MKYSKIIALSAVSTAFAIILLALGAFIEVIDISCVMFAGIAVMIPLSKKSFLGATLTYIASSLLALLVTGAKFTVVVPFAVFFGLHPLLNALQVKYRINRVIAIIVKDVWFLLAMFLYYKVLVAMTGYDLFSDFSMIPENFRAYLVPGLFVFGAVFFVLYDFVIMRLQFVVNYFANKIKF